MNEHTLPSYENLDAGQYGWRNAWGLFGPNDCKGLINLQTSDIVLQALRTVRAGKVFPLTADPGIFPDGLFGRGRAVHRLISRPGGALDDVFDNVYPQFGSQWDSLGHVPGQEGLFYNGRSRDEIAAGSADSISAWAMNGIVGRGVLLDMGRFMAAHNAEYRAEGGWELSVDDLEATRISAGVEYERGDILVLRTGFSAWLRSRKGSLGADDVISSSGLAHTEDMVAYIWDNHFSAVVSDNLAVEAWPAQRDAEQNPYGFLHYVLIGQFGLALGELWWLDDLAAFCAESGSWEFLVTSAPWLQPGAIGSPANALAIV